MRRRDFIARLGGMTFMWATAARGQQRPGPVIGFLNSLSRERWLDYLASFHQGLSEVGYVEGQNVTIDYRWAEGHYDRLPALATDLVQQHVNLIVAAGGNPSTVAAKGATTSIPIVFIVAGDPVKEGLVASLNRPGGNMTGVSIVTTSLEAKRLELLHELVPSASIAALVNPDFSEIETQLKVIQTATDKLGLQVRILNARNEAEIDRAFAGLTNQGANALLVASDPIFFALRDKLITLAVQHSIPVMYFVREFTAMGGLISYGASLSDTYRLMGVYSGRILKGDKTADLPVVQPTKFELVLNLKTAKALGITVPQALLVAADEVIE
jgi:putative ABC transport system substrate-binding protein